MNNRRLKQLTVILLLAATGTAANAGRNAVSPAPPSPYINKPITHGATVWYCWYNGSTEVYCRLGEDGTSEVSQRTRPVDPRLPPVVHDILNAPARMSARQVVIPMHGIPFEHEMVGELAHAVMCGSKEADACAIVYGENERALALLVEQRELALAAIRGSLPPLASTR